MSTGIKDKVAILGMGCTRFGERWDKDAEQLMVEAFDEASTDAGLLFHRLDVSQLDAAWLSVGFSWVILAAFGPVPVWSSFHRYKRQWHSPAAINTIQQRHVVFPQTQDRCSP